MNHIFTNLRNSIQKIGDLEHFLGVNSSILIWDREVRFMENVSVVLSDLEDRLIVWLSVFVLIHMDRGPLIIIELEPEDLTVQKWAQLQSFFHE